MFPAIDLYRVVLLLLSHQVLTVATGRAFWREIYPHKPAVQSLDHCYSAVSLIAPDFHIDHIAGGMKYSTAFHSKSCVILVSSIVQRPAGTPPPGPAENTAAIHNEIWPRVIEPARNSVDSILLINSAVSLNENVETGGGWHLRVRIYIQGVHPGPEGSSGEITVRISRG